MDAATGTDTMPRKTLALHFNAYSGKLDGGYWFDFPTRKRISGYLPAQLIYSYLAEHPDTRCRAMNV